MRKVLDRALSQFATISIEQFILMTAVEVAIFTMVVLIQMRLHGKEIKLQSVIPVFCYIIYANIVLQLTLLGRKDDSRIGVELIPFRYFESGRSGYKMLATTYSVLNILLFMPYGFIVSWLPWLKKQKGYVNWCLAVLVSLGTSLFIELMQLILGRGYYEIEDLICNTIGGAMGAVTFLIAKKLLCDRIEETDGKCC